MKIKLKTRRIISFTIKLSAFSYFFYSLFQYLISYSHKTEQKLSKYMCYYYACNQWLKNKNTGIHLAEYFYKNGYQTIAVYGIGELGTRFCEELQESNIEIKYIIDQGGGGFQNFPIKTLSDTLEAVDLIVVTAIYDYDEICESLLKAIPEYRVVSLEKVLLSVSSYG